MQTFLPYPCFYKTAKVLDYRRLGKQRLEAKIIYDTLTADWRKPKRGLGNHPAVLMWKGYEICLLNYCQIMINEWVNRGYKNTMEIPMVHIAHINNPPWLGNYDFHLSHQSNLLRKDQEYYGSIFGKVPNDLPYIWPTKITI